MSAPLVLVQHVWVAAKEAQQAQRSLLADDGAHSAAHQQALHVRGERLRKLLAADCVCSKLAIAEWVQPLACVRTVRDKHEA